MISAEGIVFYAWRQAKELLEHAAINLRLKGWFKKHILWPLMNKIISSYYRKNNILPIGELKKDIDCKNEQALKYVVYLIKHLLQVKGVNELLRDIALIQQGGNESERIYRNSIMQLHAIYLRS